MPPRSAGTAASSQRKRPVTSHTVYANTALGMAEVCRTSIVANIHAIKRGLIEDLLPTLHELADDAGLFLFYVQEFLKVTLVQIHELPRKKSSAKGVNDESFFLHLRVNLKKIDRQVLDIKDLTQQCSALPGPQMNAALLNGIKVFEQLAFVVNRFVHDCQIPAKRALMGAGGYRLELIECKQPKALHASPFFQKRLKERMGKSLFKILLEEREAIFNQKSLSAQLGNLFLMYFGQTTYQRKKSVIKELISEQVKISGIKKALHGYKDFAKSSPNQTIQKRFEMMATRAAVKMHSLSVSLMCRLITYGFYRVREAFGDAVKSPVTLYLSSRRLQLLIQYEIRTNLFPINRHSINRVEKALLRQSKAYLAQSCTAKPVKLPSIARGRMQQATTIESAASDEQMPGGAAAATSPTVHVPTPPKESEPSALRSCPARRRRWQIRRR